MERLALWLYSAFVWLAQPLVRRKLRRRAQAEPLYGHAVEERFGHYPPLYESLMPVHTAWEQGHFIWIHAVSLGETRAAAILLNELRAQWPHMRLLLTHGTATGRAEGEALLQPGDVQVWQPWDTPGAIGRFLQQFRPSLGILMETEVWPNLVAGCRARGVPLVLANARMSERSMASALRLRVLSRAAYAGLSAVWAQTDDDATRLRRLGAPVEGVLGNLKFDARPDAAQTAQGRAWRAQSPHRVLLLASSREGEEAAWLEIFKQKRALALTRLEKYAIEPVADRPLPPPAVQWLIVPRHPQRFDAVAQLLGDAGLRVARRSLWGAPPADADVWLGDSLGEMSLYYGLADVALLGGSFAPLGGQNLIEAAACGCPVVMGPHTFNFDAVARNAEDAEAALRAADLADGVRLATQLAADPERLATARARALQFADAHRGAAAHTAQALGHLLAGTARRQG